MCIENPSMVARTRPKVFSSILVTKSHGLWPCIHLELMACLEGRKMPLAKLCFFEVFVYGFMGFITISHHRLKEYLFWLCFQTPEANLRYPFGWETSPRMPVESEDFFREIPYQENENPDGGHCYSVLWGASKYIHVSYHFSMCQCLIDVCTYPRVRPALTHKSMPKKWTCIPATHVTPVWKEKREGDERDQRKR